MYGKKLRMTRLVNPKSGKVCIVPIDHGATIGPVDGIREYLSTIECINSGGADAVVLHKGLLKKVAQCPELGKGQYILHLSVSTKQSPYPDYKVLIGSVEEAVKLGADGVSVHVNLGVENEAEMLKDLGRVASASFEWGIPLLAMMYSFKSNREAYDIAHAARLAEELGADIVKVAYPGSIKSMEHIVKSVSIPVIIAGGNKMNSGQELLYMISDALSGGAAGVAIGRNIFEHRDPLLMTTLIRKFVHGEIKLQECLDRLEKTESARSRNLELQF